MNYSKHNIENTEQDAEYNEEHTELFVWGSKNIHEVIL